MSRSGYDEGDMTLADCRYRGQVASAMRGRRGQVMFRDLKDALEAMPVKRLIAGRLETRSHLQVCALGALGQARGLRMRGLDPENAKQVAEAFDIAEPLAREVTFMNDDEDCGDTPSSRWARMYRWVSSQIKEAK